MTAFSRPRPLIGVPTQVLQTFAGIPDGFPPSWIMSQRYIQTLAAADAVPWMLPLLCDDLATMRAMYNRLDGVFLPGGADVDPSSYGAERHPKCDVRTDTSRDHLELAFARWAIEDRKPILGVCRGLQVINLASGGSVWQDLAEQCPGSDKHDYFPFDGRYTRDHLAHAIRTTPGSRVHAILGCDELLVNSMHHQGVDRVGAGLVVTAMAPDGVIEAIEGTTDAFLLGVQWHPETLTDRAPRMRRIFGAFIEEAAAWRERQTAHEALVGGAVAAAA